MVPGHESTETAPVSVAPTVQTASTAINTCVQTNNIEPCIPQASSSVCSINQDASVPVSVAPVPLASGSMINARPGSMVRVPESIANGSEYLSSSYQKKVKEFYSFVCIISFDLHQELLYTRTIVNEMTLKGHEMNSFSVKSLTYSVIAHIIALIMHLRLGTRDIQEILRGIFDHLEIHPDGVRQPILEQHHSICATHGIHRLISIKLYATMLASYSIHINQPDSMIRFVFRLLKLITIGFRPRIHTLSLVID